MQKLTRALYGRRWQPSRSLKFRPDPAHPELWLPQAGERLRQTPEVSDLVLDMSAIEVLDLEELAILARFSTNLRAEGRSLALRRLRPGPLSLLRRLGLTQELGVRSTRWAGSRKEMRCSKTPKF